jgi:hypothetical protein
VSCIKKYYDRVDEQTTLFDYYSETKYNVMLTGLYTCTSIIDYGKVVFNHAVAARGTTRANAV